VLLGNPERQKVRGEKAPNSMVEESEKPGAKWGDFGRKKKSFVLWQYSSYNPVCDQRVLKCEPKCRLLHTSP
jgi:hypothetical protein